MSDIQIILRHDVYLDNTVPPITLPDPIYAGDAGAQRIMFRVFKKHGAQAPIDLSECNVTAHFVRPDEGDVVITGTSGTEWAYVDLPAACYVYPGTFTLLIRVTGEELITSVIRINGRVEKATSDTIIDPGTNVGNLDRVLAKLDAVEAAADEAIVSAGTASTAAETATADAQTAASAAAAAQEDAMSAETSAGSAHADAEAAEQSALDAEAWATGKRNGEDVDEEDPTYGNNAKKYAQDAGGSAAAAGVFKQEAEAWAKGTKNGQAVPASDPAYQKNAKYYAEQAFSGTPEGYAALVGDVGDLKSTINGIVDGMYTETESPTTWSIGNWSTSSGTAGTNNKRIKTSLNGINNFGYTLKADSGVLFFPLFYGASGYIALSENPWRTECNVAALAPDGATSFRLTAKTDPETVLTDVVNETAAKIHWLVDGKVDKNQGAANAGKALVVGDDGMVVPGVPDAVSELADGIGDALEITDMVVVHKCVNRCNPDEVVLGQLTTDGTIDTAVTGNRTSGFIPVTPGESIQIYRNNSEAAARIYHMRLGTYDAQKTLINMSTTTSNSAYTVADGVAYIRYSFDVTYTAPMVAANYTQGDPYIRYVPTYVTADYDFLTAESSNLLKNLPMRGKVIVNFGDSIFGNFRSEVSGSSSESISHMVSMMTGATCHNVAFGGTHAKTMGGTARAPMDFQSLVTAIIGGDWTAQEAYATAQSEDYLARVQALEAIDFTKVDVVTVSYGTNDWSSQVTPDQYEAALTDGINRLQTAFPQLLCVVCTPIIRFKHSDDSGDDDAEDSGESEGTGAIVSSDTIENSSGYKLTQIVEKAEAVGRALHCPVCENYWSLGINIQNYTTFMGGMAAADMVHPNAMGRRLIANHLADTLNRL